MKPYSFTREDLMMNKNIFIVLAVIFIVIVVMDTGEYSWSQQNMNRQNEETIVSSLTEKLGFQLKNVFLFVMEEQLSAEMQTVESHDVTLKLTEGWLKNLIEFSGSFTSSAWTDWKESDGIQEMSDGNDQADDIIILFTGMVEDESENISPPEVKIMVEEIDNGSEKQPHYDILVDLNTEYIGSQNWKVDIVNEEEKYPPKFKITEGQIDCKVTIFESGSLTRTVKRTIDGRIYCIESASEGAAGTVYTQYAYSTIKSGSFITVSCVIRYPLCINYSEPYRTECAKERETFDLDKIVGYIVKNLNVRKDD